MSGHVPKILARTSQTPKAGEIVYQCREADTEIAETRDAGTVRGPTGASKTPGRPQSWPASHRNHSTGSATRLVVSHPAAREGCGRAAGSRGDHFSSIMAWKRALLAASPWGAPRGPRPVARHGRADHRWSP
jgi:hypothetical protein